MRRQRQTDCSPLPGAVLSMAAPDVPAMAKVILLLPAAEMTLCLPEEFFKVLVMMGAKEHLRRQNCCETAVRNYSQKLQDIC